MFASVFVVVAAAIVEKVEEGTTTMAVNTGNESSSGPVAVTAAVAATVLGF